VLTAIAGSADILTSSQYRLFPFYIIPIIISTYYLNIYYSIFLSLVSVLFILISVYSDFSTIEIHQIWNSLMTFIAYIVIIYITKILTHHKSIEKEKRYLEEKNKILDQSLKEKEMLIRETHHRMKNNLSSINSFISLADAEEDNEFLKKLNNRIQIYTILYEKLSYTEETGSRVVISEYLHEIIGLIFQSFDVKEDDVEYSLTGGDFYIGTNHASLIGIIINELVTNSLKHAFNEKTDFKKAIYIRISQLNGELNISYSDNGPGCNLSRMDLSEKHIGMLLVDSITNQLGGDMIYDNSHGSEFKFVFTKVPVS
jgi:two-component sensor histidine kinase